MTAKEFGLSKYPDALCFLECSTNCLDDWEGPDLYDYIIRVDGRTIGDYAPYPDRAWELAKIEIESEPV